MPTNGIFVNTPVLEIILFFAMYGVAPAIVGRFSCVAIDFVTGPHHMPEWEKAVIASVLGVLVAVALDLFTKTPMLPIFQAVLMGAGFAFLGAWAGKVIPRICDNLTTVRPSKLLRNPEPADLRAFHKPLHALPARRLKNTPIFMTVRRKKQ